MTGLIQNTYHAIALAETIFLKGMVIANMTFPGTTAFCW
jgi:hypothetical protein